MSQRNAALPRLLQVENLALAVTQKADFSLATLLQEISQKGLFRARGHNSFGAYTDAQYALFRIGRRHAYRLVRGAHVLALLRSHRLPPTSEKQVLELPAAAY